ncbi:hypothetical protein SeMB42_g03470 [Synchytrium endobioticum]|uniref:Uncharacterized protein n=1 Tax=Synchytrium endobioticum TaxID=286115 RepID=A0A507D700_9FUNG|nr:hypothetical protein SeMB42_g03470 [Synchytrium endobioticum]TPX47735.1 hypothetical protein SeLEV6574_g02498 [Synchytrium endobioticum]
MSIAALAGLASLATSSLSFAQNGQGLQQNLMLDYCNGEHLVGDANCDIKMVEDIHKTLAYDVSQLVSTSVFRYFKINVYKDCPFWREDMLCFQRDCEVEAADEEEIPEDWKSKRLSTVDFGQESGFKKFTECCNDKDFCVWEDEGSNDGEFVNLLRNPERFTGYAGPSAERVWSAIYDENCFNAASAYGELAADDELKAQTREVNSDKMCLEARVFHRLISGFHSSISTHLCNEYLDRKTGVWFANLTCFMTRVGMYPERVQNLYFNYVVFLRAISKLGSFLDSFDICSNGASADSKLINDLLRKITSRTEALSPPFDESTLFKGPDALELKKEFKEHFRNISRIMDCVGCEKCRLWGKIQVLGMGTALKILFSFDSPSDVVLNRREIVALFNAFARISESISAVSNFRTMYRTQQPTQDIPEIITAKARTRSIKTTMAPPLMVLNPVMLRRVALTVGIILGVGFAYRRLIRSKGLPSADASHQYANGNGNYVPATSVTKKREVKKC